MDIIAAIACRRVCRKCNPVRLNPQMSDCLDDRYFDALIPDRFYLIRSE